MSVRLILVDAALKSPLRSSSRTISHGVTMQYSTCQRCNFAWNQGPRCRYGVATTWRDFFFFADTHDHVPVRSTFTIVHARRYCSEIPAQWRRCTQKCDQVEFQEWSFQAVCTLHTRGSAGHVPVDPMAGCSPHERMRLLLTRILWNRAPTAGWLVERLFSSRKFSRPQRSLNELAVASSRYLRLAVTSTRESFRVPRHFRPLNERLTLSHKASELFTSAGKSSG